MPKGQYTRKPRKAAEAMASELMRDAVAYNEQQAAKDAADSEWARGDQWPHADKPSADTEMDEIARLLISDPEKAAELANQTDAQPEPPHKTFDSWMAEDDVPLPANDRVSQMVRQWAGQVCSDWHDVTWQPANGGRAIEVTLITPHGTSILEKEAGNWREADISAVLECMTEDLRL